MFCRASGATFQGILAADPSPAWIQYSLLRGPHPHVRLGKSSSTRGSGLRVVSSLRGRQSTPCTVGSRLLQTCEMVFMSKGCPLVMRLSHMWNYNLKSAISSGASLFPSKTRPPDTDTRRTIQSPIRNGFSFLGAFRRTHASIGRRVALISLNICPLHRSQKADRHPSLFIARTASTAPRPNMQLSCFAASYRQVE